MAGKRQYTSEEAREILSKMRRLAAQAEEERQNAAAAAFDHDPKKSHEAAKKVKAYMKQALHLNVELIQLIDPEANDLEKSVAAEQMTKIETAWEDARTEAKSAHK